MMRYRAGPSHCSLIYRKKKEEKHLCTTPQFSLCISTQKLFSLERAGKERGRHKVLWRQSEETHTRTYTHTQHTQALKSRPSKPKLKDSPVIFFDCKSNQTTFNKNAEKQTKRFLKNITESWGLRGASRRMFSSEPLHYLSLIKSQQPILSCFSFIYFFPPHSRSI